MLCDAWFACRLPCSSLHVITHCSTNCAHHKADTSSVRGQCALYERCGGSNGGATYHECPHGAECKVSTEWYHQCEPKGKHNGKMKRPSPSPRVCILSVISAVNVCPHLTCGNGRELAGLNLASLQLHVATCTSIWPSAWLHGPAGRPGTCHERSRACAMHVTSLRTLSARSIMRAAFAGAQGAPTGARAQGA